MDICTINEFREALRAPQHHFATLDTITPDLDTLTHTTHFAECEAVLRGERVMLYAPITPRALSLAHHANRVLYPTRGNNFVRMAIMSCEMMCDAERRCSVIVEFLGDTRHLSDVINKLHGESLLLSLESMRRRYALYNISHNNLMINSIIIDKDGCMMPIRQYYTSAGAGNDDDRYDMLFEHIKEFAANSPDSAIPCTPTATVHYTPLEANRRVEYRSHDVGYTDSEGNPAIAGGYRTATDFYEGRAVVSDASGKVGVIDRNGKIIVPLAYDFGRLDKRYCGARMWLGTRYADFDYMGNQISVWQEED